MEDTLEKLLEYFEQQLNLQRSGEIKYTGEEAYFDAVDVCKNELKSFHQTLVMPCGLSEVEFTERERLLELQRSRTRWFSQEEFDRLKELSNKMFANAGSPHSA